MSSTDWKNEIKKESKKSSSFGGLNAQWGSLGLISKKVEKKCHFISKKIFHLILIISKHFYLYQFS